MMGSSSILVVYKLQFGNTNTGLDVPFKILLKEKEVTQSLSLPVIKKLYAYNAAFFCDDSAYDIIKNH